MHHLLFISLFWDNAFSPMLHPRSMVGIPQRLIPLKLELKSPYCLFLNLLFDSIRWWTRTLPRVWLRRGWGIGVRATCLPPDYRVIILYNLTLAGNGVRTAQGSALIGLKGLDPFMNHPWKIRGLFDFVYSDRTAGIVHLFLKRDTLPVHCAPRWMLHTSSCSYERISARIRDAFISRNAITTKNRAMGH